MSHYMDNFLYKHHSRFRKGYKTQYCLLNMLERWKSAVDKGKSRGALLTDLSKAFDCLLHHILLAELHAYELGLLSLKLIHSYYKNRKQRTKIDSIHSSWEWLLFGVPQDPSEDSYFLIFFCMIYSCQLFNEWNRFYELCRWQQTICYRW